MVTQQEYDSEYVPLTGDRVVLFWNGVDLWGTPRAWEIRGHIAEVDPAGDLFRLIGRERSSRQRVDKWFPVDSVANDSVEIRQATYRRRWTFKGCV